MITLKNFWQWVKSAWDSYDGIRIHLQRLDTFSTHDWVLDLWNVPVSNPIHGAEGVDRGISLHTFWESNANAIVEYAKHQKDYVHDAYIGGKYGLWGKYEVIIEFNTDLLSWQVRENIAK